MSSAFLRVRLYFCEESFFESNVDSASVLSVGKGLSVAVSLFIKIASRLLLLLLLPHEGGLRTREGHSLSYARSGRVQECRRIYFRACILCCAVLHSTNCRSQGASCYLSFPKSPVCCASNFVKLKIELQ